MSTLDVDSINALWPLNGMSLIYITEQVSQSTHYVLSGEVIQKQASTTMISTDTISATGEDSVTISSIPEGATVTLSGAVSWSGTVTGGSLSFSSTAPGKINILIAKNPEWVEWEGSVNAT